MGADVRNVIADHEHAVEVVYKTLMRAALEEARAAQAEGEIPVGAVLAREGVVIARAHNCPIALSDPTAHAEVLALRTGAAAVGNYRIPGATLYVTVEPCIMCVGAMLQARITRLVYGVPDPKGGAVALLYQIASDPRLNHRIEVVSGILEEECRALLHGFFRLRR